MVRPDHLGEASAATLDYLWTLDARAGGYTRRGVRGWARREDVEMALGLPIPELLPRLRDRALVEEDHVHVSGTRPVGVYRITATGDLLLARHQGRGARPPWPAGGRGTEDVAVFIPPGARVALRLLREAFADPRSSPLLPDGGPGWRTEDELWQELHPDLDPWLDDSEPGEWVPGDPPWQRGDAPAAGPPPVFGRNDLDWLERPGLAQRWGVTRPGGTRPVVLWRVTAAGLAVVPLEWHPPGDPNAG
jgi:hypothetical protein